MKTLTRIAVLAAPSFVLLAVAASPARAAPPYVERGLTLPRGNWSFDIGLGVSHDGAINNPLTGAGFNFEFGVAPIENLELGLRDGIRFGDDARAICNGILCPDQAGRLYDRETIGYLNQAEIFANPEFYIRGRLAHTRVFELALEGRLYAPFANNSFFGMEFGVPMAFHFGDKVRLDMGVYTPVVFFDRTYYGFSFPINVWFQVTPKLWLGPEGGFRYDHQDAPAPAQRPFIDHTYGYLGFGMGYQLTRGIDMKWQILSPHITDNRGIDDFELGFGFQFRIE
jgi:hypothetical protein